MEKRKVRVTIAKDGSYKLEALEGFSGTSCVQGTQQIELALGGTTVETGKTQAYYDPDGDDGVMIKFD